MVSVKRSVREWGEECKAEGEIVGRIITNAVLPGQGPPAPAGRPA